MKASVWIVGVVTLALAGIAFIAQSRKETRGAAEFSLPPASPEKGEALFFDLACWRCHSLGETPLPGNQDYDHLGPDLADVGNRLDADHIRQSLLAPSAVIAEPQSDHQDEGGNSFMPPFEEALPDQDLRDLVAFLSNQRIEEVPESKNVVLATSSNFEQVVLKAENLILMDFWAEWCQPCLELEPILSKVADEYGGRVTVAKINVDDEADLVAEYVPDNIFPCLILMREGKLLDRCYGTDPEQEPEAFLRKWIGTHLASSE